MRISRQASLKKFNTFNVTENADVIYEVEDIVCLKILYLIIIKF